MSLFLKNREEIMVDLDVAVVRSNWILDVLKITAVGFNDDLDIRYERMRIMKIVRKLLT
jgi:hypothetical protein